MFTIWIEDSGETLENLHNKSTIEKFNKVFGTKLSEYFTHEYGCNTISEMIRERPVITGVFPLTNKPFKFHFEWDSYFTTDDYETSQYLKIFHEVWDGSGEAGWLDELVWLSNKILTFGGKQ